MPAPRPLTGPREQGSEQRFLSFVLLSIAVFLFYQSFMAPPPPPPPAVAEKDEDDDKPATDDADPAAEAKNSSDAPAEIAEQDEPETQLLTLGSAALDSRYRMLVTLDNRGAGVRRIEMSADEFRDLDDRSGYLGYLGLEDAEDGRQRVRVVGAGTPAEAAGLEVGDEIVDAEPFFAGLAKAKPGESVDLKIVRGGDEQTLTATLSKRPLAVVRPESENVRKHNPAYADASTDVDSFLLTISELNGDNAGENPTIQAANEKLTEGAWEVVASDERSVTFRKRIAELGLEFDKRYELAQVDEESAEPAYHLVYDLQVKNLLPREQTVAYDLHGPNGLPIEGWWYAAYMRFGRKENGDGAWGSVGLRDVVSRFEGTTVLQSRCSKIVEGKVDPLDAGASLAYAGVDAQYFSVVMIPQKKSFEELVFAAITPRLATPELPEEGTAVTFNNTTFTATRLPKKLSAAGGEGDSYKDAFTVFAGPKRPELLKQYTAAGNPEYNLEKLLYYGWFGPVAKGMLWLLHLFGGVGNYGIAIIMLTVVVRGALFPLSRKQAASMAKMQALKPEMDKLQDRYKNDAEKKARAIQELYSKNGVSPLSGCLPAFVQLPIFIGLYRALAVDIELRQAPLISESIRFCSNLAAPDMLLNWSWMWPDSFNNGIGFGFFPGLGPFFNALPMFTVALFLIQQKMFMPPPANEQAELQQKMMMYIMPIFGLLFFKVPSGLCLYFIASSVWGIAERKLVPKPEAPEVQGFSKPIAKKPPATQSAALAKQAAKRASGGGKKKKKRK
ncbi:MAG: YidC/Oxa1 family insertase periplasmic-domain containing protein [Planctomycetota bacterium]